jgi:hypothetical protein
VNVSFVLPTFGDLSTHSDAEILRQVTAEVAPSFNPDLTDVRNGAAQQNKRAQDAYDALRSQLEAANTQKQAILEVSTI